MVGLGTIINAGSIIVGGLIGMLVGKKLTERFQRIITVAMALSVIAMALSDMMARMLVVTSDGVSTQGTYVMIFSLVLGAIVGELIDIDRHIERFGAWLKRKTGSSGDASFVDGFVTASVTVCIGAMAVVGSIMDGLSGDYSILLTKAIMDGIILVAMTAAMGKGCIFSAIPVILLQGSITALARVIEPLMTEAAVHNLSMVGAALILCIGVNLMAGGAFRIKVANLLPAVIFAVIAAFIPFL